MGIIKVPVMGAHGLLPENLKALTWRSFLGLLVSGFRPAGVSEYGRIREKNVTLLLKLPIEMTPTK